MMERMDAVYQFFPRLGERRPQIAGTLSGGEHRMLSVGMAMIMNPKVMLLDEPTNGLSPVIAEELLYKVAEISRDLQHYGAPGGGEYQEGHLHFSPGLHHEERPYRS